MCYDTFLIIIPLNIQITNFQKSPKTNNLGMTFVDNITSQSYHHSFNNTFFNHK